MPAVVMINPAAGGGRAGALAADIRAHLSARRPAPPVVVTADADAMRGHLRGCEPGTRVVLVGGDGTVHQALPALLEARLELAVLPCGSGNDLARALGVARWPWPRGLDLGLDGRASGLDLGEASAGGRRWCFASSLTAGFDSAVAGRAAGLPGWIPARLRYLGATLAETGALRSWPVQVAVDGAPAHAGAVLFASVVNTPTYGSGLPVAPHARVDDHRLDLVIAADFDRLGVLAMLPRLLVGRHLGRPGVHLHTARRVTIHSEGPPLPLAADGETLGTFAQVEVAVLPAALGAVRAAADAA